MQCPKGMVSWEKMMMRGVVLHQVRNDEDSDPGTVQV